MDRNASLADYCEQGFGTWIWSLAFGSDTFFTMTLLLVFLAS